MNKYLKSILLIGVGLGLMGVFFVSSVIVYFSLSLPDIDSLTEYRPSIPSQILARDGTVLAEIGRESRELVAVNEIPQKIIDSFLAAEDSNFFEHQGVDYAGIMRAMWVNVKAGRVVQGGSTITQQVAKSLLLTRERSWKRKIKDILLAQKIEKKFSKKEILYLYLNQVYLGGGYYGVKAAFEGYFGKELEEATWAEAAIVAGLLVAPGKYSPYVQPQAAKSRQSYVLGRLLVEGKINREQYENAVSEKIKFRLRKPNPFKAGYFTDWVRQRVIALVGEERFLTEGFKIQTTLDYELQKQSEEAVLKGIKEIDKRQGYKGPIGHLPTKEEWKEFEKKSRAEIYSQGSLYFTIADDYSREYELAVEDRVLDNIDEHKQDFTENRNNKGLLPGYYEEDPLLEHLEKDLMYKAVVKRVDDKMRLIYVSVAGVSGIIPYKMFRWARPREFTENKNFYPYATVPSRIVSPGDIIEVSILDMEGNMIEHVNSSYHGQLKRSSVEKERYLICLLDQEPEVQGAALAMDPDSGEILSFVGGGDFSKSQFNRIIQSKRQPGSAFKPFIYAVALENGFNPASIIIDSPEALGGADESLNWKPRNYDGKFKGAITFRNSLEQSRNVPTIKVADKVGIAKIKEFLDRIGFKAEVAEDLSIALGSFGISLIDIVSSYAIFPNGGKIVDPISIVSMVDRDGNSYEIFEKFKEKEIEEKERMLAEKEEEGIETPTPDTEAKEESEKEENQFLATLGGKQVYDSRLAYLMTNLLKGVVQHGTGRRTKDISPFIGGKTGTTNNYVDAWFIGFSKNLVTGVWTGFDDNKTMGWPESGAKAALPIWKEVMADAIKKFGQQDFKVPMGIVNVRINKDTGKLGSAGEGNTFIESFVEGTEPGQETLMEEVTDPEKTVPSSDFFEEDEYFNQQ